MERPEAPRQVKIERVHGGPGAPVGVGALVGALEKIGPPGLPAAQIGFSDKGPQHVEGNKKPHLPKGFRGNLGCHHRRQGRGHRDLTGRGGRQGPEVAKPAGHTGRIQDVGRQQGAAAVELEVEVPAVRLRLHKKFHAAVPVNRVLKARVETTHESVVHLEDPAEPGRAVNELGVGRRPVRAALRPEVGHRQGRHGFPESAVIRGTNIRPVLNRQHRVVFGGRHGAPGDRFTPRAECARRPAGRAYQRPAAAAVRISW